MSRLASTSTPVPEDDDAALLDVEMPYTPTKSFAEKYVKTILVVSALVVLLVVGIAVIGIVAYLGSSSQGGDHHDSPTDGLNNTVIMISIDGFRADYLDRCISKSICKNLQSIVSNGVRSQGMKPVFVSKTFPNHYSIATGLYAESHGIVSNK